MRAHTTKEITRFIPTIINTSTPIQVVQVLVFVCPCNAHLRRKRRREICDQPLRAPACCASPRRLSSSKASCVTRLMVGAVLISCRASSSGSRSSGRTRLTSLMTWRPRKSAARWGPGWEPACGWTRIASGRRNPGVRGPRSRGGSGLGSQSGQAFWRLCVVVGFLYICFDAEILRCTLLY